MKKIFVLGLMTILLFTSQQTFVVVASEQRGFIIAVNGTDFGNTAFVDTPACCDNDTDTCIAVQRNVATKVSKKKPHQFKKDYIFKNRHNQKNQTATNFYGVQFHAKSLFDAYSGERAYLLTGGDER